MSYCVNCGVELDNSAEKCALCGTEVINPNKTKEDASVHPFPEKIIIPENNLKKYRAVVASVVMLLPIIICIPITRFITPESHWSVYVASTIALLWIVFVLPFICKYFKNPYISLTFDAIVAVGYIYVFYWLNSSGIWFFKIAIPMVVSFLILGYFLIYLLKKPKNSVIRKAAYVFITLALFFAATEFIFLISMPNLIVDCIALSMFFINAVIGIFLRFTAENKQFRAWVSRKFFL